MPLQSNTDRSKIREGVHELRGPALVCLSALDIHVGAPVFFTPERTVTSTDTSV